MDRETLARQLAGVLRVAWAGRAALACTVAWILLAASPLPFSRGGTQGFVLRSLAQLPSLACWVAAVGWFGFPAGLDPLVPSRDSTRRLCRLWLPVFLSSYAAQLAAMAAFILPGDAGLDMLIGSGAGVPHSIGGRVALAFLVAHLVTLGLGLWLCHGIVRSLALALGSVEGVVWSSRIRLRLGLTVGCLGLVLARVVAANILGPRWSVPGLAAAEVLIVIGLVLWTIALWRATGLLVRRSHELLGAADPSVVADCR